MQIYGLEPGALIRIKRSFRDYDGTEWTAGRELRLVAHNVFPYEDGHTLTFDDGSVIRLSGNVPENEAIMNNDNDLYWELVGTDAG